VPVSRAHCIRARYPSPLLLWWGALVGGAFSPDSACGRGFSPDSACGRGFSPDSACGRGFSPESRVSGSQDGKAGGPGKRGDGGREDLLLCDDLLPIRSRAVGCQRAATPFTGVRAAAR